MFVRNFLRCAVAVAIATPVYAFADSFNMKPGAWEMTTTTVTTGMPVPTDALANMPAEQRAKMEKIMQARAGKPSTHVAKSCVTQNDLDQDRVLKSDDEAHCKRKIMSKSATKMVLEQTCDVPRASTANITVEAKTSESMVANMDMELGGASGKVHVEIKGRWLNASCAGVKTGN